MIPNGLMKNWNLRQFLTKRAKYGYINKMPIEKSIYHLNQRHA